MGFFDSALKKYTEAIEKTCEELTEIEKMQAVVNAVIEAATKKHPFQDEQEGVMAKTPLSAEMNEYASVCVEAGTPVPISALHEFAEKVAQIESDVRKMLAIARDRHLMNCDARDKIERILERL